MNPSWVGCRNIHERGIACLDVAAGQRPAAPGQHVVEPSVGHPADVLQVVVVPADVRRGAVTLHDRHEDVVDARRHGTTALQHVTHSARQTDIYREMRNVAEYFEI